MVRESTHRMGRGAGGSSAGFSLVEIVVVITIVGIMAFLLLPSFRELLPGSRYSTALANMELLNQSVLKFNQANWELVLTNSAADTINEEKIVRSLQYRGTEASASPGAPYLDPTLTINGTDDASTYRAHWNGHMFQLLDAGTAGDGLNLLLMTSSGTSYTFPNGYKPVGAP